MISEKVEKWLDDRIKKGVREGYGTDDEIREMEISARKRSILNLDRQKRKEEDEIEYLIKSRLTGSGGG